MPQGIRHVPNNKSQNRAFREATQGLDKAQKERVRREVERRKRQFEDFGFKEIKEITDAIKG
jgi:hypothetical protein